MSTVIYLDHFATTPMLPEVWDAMRPFASDLFGNPSSSHTIGRRARRALDEARERIAAQLDAFPDEVIFTGSATEANNLALFGLAGEAPATLWSSPIEHPCVIEPLHQLAARGFDVKWFPVTPEGIVTYPSSEPVGRLHSVMRVNHETGAIQPVRHLKTYTHTDAAQAIGKIPVRFHELGVDALTISAHKFGGPKGVGALLLKRDVPLNPRLFGGHQQAGRRPGTEPVALAVGMATALEIAHERMSVNLTHVEALRTHFIHQLVERCQPVVLNGPTDPTRRVPHVLNVSFPGCRAELLLMKLDLAGVACSTGSACSSGSLLPSPVLRAMGVPDDVLRSAMRFSFAPTQTHDQIDEVAIRIISAVEQMRTSR